MKTGRIRVSQKWRERVRLSSIRQYQIANLSDLHPGTLSAILNHIVPVKPNDERVLRVGKVLGLKPEECFEGDS